MSSELPQNWVSVPLAEIANFNPGIDKGNLTEDEEVPFVPMPAVEALTGAIDVSERRPFGKVKSGFTSFMTGDVLFAKITPCMENGKMAIVPPLPKSIGFGTTEFHVLRSSGAVDPRYLYYFVSSASLRHEAQHNMTGAVGQKRVPKRYLETKQIPLPPLAEQRRSVEMIEVLFAQLDKGEEAVREVQALLKRYRQSVLKAAVSGEMAQSGRSGWRTVALGSLLEDIRYGTAKKCGYGGGDTPVLRIPNVVAGEIDLRDLKYTDLPERDREKLALEVGDILIVRSNGSANFVARGAVVDEEAVGMAFAGYLIRLRVNQAEALPDFVHLCLNSPQIRAAIERQARSTSGVHNINSGEVKSIPIELPPLEEQAQIVAEAGDAIGRTVDLEAWCASELARSAALRQSILKDAFSGRLVPQDAADEPAAALLERIRSEHTPARPTRRKATA